MYIIDTKSYACFLFSPNVSPPFSVALIICVVNLIGDQLNSKFD